MPSTAVDFEEEDMGPGLLQSGEALLRELHAMQHPTVDVHALPSSRYNRRVGS